MKKAFKSTLAVAAVATAIAGVAAVPSLVNAWDNSGDPRPSYTIEEIETGALGPVGDDAKNQAGYPGKIVFNSISNGTMGDEKNFVGVRECVLREDGRCEGNGKTNKWEGNDMNIEVGKTYIIRLYVHNNNPHKEDATAENVKVRFSLPNTASTTAHVNGYITTSTGEYSEYIDYVNLHSNTPFRLKYIEGSALYENNVINGNGKAVLSDNIVQAKDGGVLIGYDKLDGKIPGCFQYDGVATIQVKAEPYNEFLVEKTVRNVTNNDQSWSEAVDAKVGDIVEFQIQYKNKSDKWHNDVTIRDVLPANLKYIAGSTRVYNTKHLTGTTIVEDNIISNGINIGSYDSGANAFIRFRAEVVDENLACGANGLINWGQAQAGAYETVVLQDYARVNLNKVCENTPNEEPKKDEETPTNLPTTGPEAVAGGVIAAGSIVTAAGYYIASRRQLR